MHACANLDFSPQPLLPHFWPFLKIEHCLQTFTVSCLYSVSGGVGECGLVIVEVMVLLIVLIVLEYICGGVGGSDDQVLR